MTALFRIIVRAKKDADAIRSMIASFYGKWEIDVRTLKGKRTKDGAIRELSKMAIDKIYDIVLLGRNDCGLIELEKDLPENFSFQLVDKKKIRNMRMFQLSEAFEIARSKIRNSITWREGTYLLSHKFLGIIKDFSPAYDIFFVIGKKFIDSLKDLGFRFRGIPLIVRKFNGIHELYLGNLKIGEMKIPSRGKPLPVKIKEAHSDISIGKIIERNRDIIALHEGISLHFLKTKGNEFDEIYVPWSGGKDSTTVLLLALKAFPKEKVRPIYISMGVDFPQTEEYIEKVSSLLNITYIKETVDLKTYIRKRGYPTYNNRWCTVLKVKALHKKIKEIKKGRALIVVGDRDAESRQRSIRPPFRLEEGMGIITPIKVWSTALVQLYLLINKIPLNELYTYGFYRIGCYICPALRSWEIFLLRQNRDLYEKLRNMPLFKDYLKRITFMKV